MSPGHLQTYRTAHAESSAQWTAANASACPFRVTLQILRDCNLGCKHCPEQPGVAPLATDGLDEMLDGLCGVSHLVVSGGEPLAHPDVWDILARIRLRFDTVTVVTNATLVDRRIASKLASVADRVRIGIEGPRAIHNRVRGDFDRVIAGARHLASAGVVLEITTTVLPANAEFLVDVGHIADALGAEHLQVSSPVPKGGAIETIEQFSLAATVEPELTEARRRHGWKVAISTIGWLEMGDGPRIIIEPNGRVIATPVPTAREGYVEVGDLHSESIASIWARYPYQKNHIDYVAKQPALEKSPQQVESGWRGVGEPTRKKRAKK